MVIHKERRGFNTCLSFKIDNQIFNPLIFNSSLIDHLLIVPKDFTNQDGNIRENIGTLERLCGFLIFLTQIPLG